MKLIIIANRLPISVKSVEPLEFTRSPGGLVSGIETFIKKKNISDWIWIGWIGANIRKKDVQKIKSSLIDKKYLPIYLSEKSINRFYNGFCNKTLWPLFHDMHTYTIYDESMWESYKEVNQIFLKALTENIEIDKDTYIWVHDYHLMLLPNLIRCAFPDAKIGFFLHIPFPPPEIFAQLPWRKEILEGLLGSDLIGFHTYEYTINFLRSVLRVFGIEHAMGELVYSDRLVKVDTFPMGIDFDLFNSMKGISEKVKNIKKTLNYKKIIFSVDRLDYTKGIYNRLLAFEDFLQRREDIRGKVVLILNLVPSREGVEQYQSMKRQIEEKIAQINGKFGSVDWVPILYHYKSLPIEDLVAHYRASDVILVTPIKDGMNLIAKEFVASRNDLRGVLILSEFAGSSRELGETLIVNPNSIQELSKSIETAVEMPQEEQEARLSIMRERLKRYDVLKWGIEFLKSLKDTTSKKEILKTKRIDNRTLQKIKDAFKNAKKRILFLDYDGTLVPLARKPQLAIPNQEVKDVLHRLGASQDTQIILISGREKQQLESWFGDLPINLVAEHGCWVKESDGNWHSRCNVQNELKERVKAIMNTYVDRLPQSFVEEKDYTLVFHYRNADPEMASLRVSELLDQLKALIADTELSILVGNKVVEVRPAGINKGTTAVSFCSECDFILAIGDDITDEDMFRALSPKAITIKVGVSPSFAMYHLTSQADAINLLKYLVENA